MNPIAEIGPNVQTIVWDLDGTLLDSFGIYRDCLNEVLLGRDMPAVSEAILRDNHHGFITDSIASALENAGQQITEAELTEIVQAFMRLDNVAIEDVDNHLFADAVALARQAYKADKRQIVATNRPHGKDRGNGSPRNLIKNSCLGTIMSKVLCGDDSEVRKPHRAFLEPINVADLGKIVVIGDQFVDAQFAQNIGAAAILVTRAEKIAHLDELEGLQTRAVIVPSLRDVRVVPSE